MPDRIDWNRAARGVSAKRGKVGGQLGKTDVGSASGEWLELEQP